MYSDYDFRSYTSTGTDIFTTGTGILLLLVPVLLPATKEGAPEPSTIVPPRTTSVASAIGERTQHCHVRSQLVFVPATILYGFIKESELPY